MLYSLTKPFAKIALGVYFRKIYLSNLARLPKDKPILIAANHPTAFIEPCILAGWLDRPLSFIARGDLYLNNLVFKKLYDWYYLTPVFRKEDAGYADLKNNYQSFERCFDTLKSNRILMILVEGGTIHEKRLRPIKKGAARIVFGTLEKYGDLDIHIVPVGVNYTDVDNFRSIAMLDVGEPIKTTDYTESYQNNPAKAVIDLTKEIEGRLKERVVHIENKESERVVDKLLTMHENEWGHTIWPALSDQSKFLFAQKKVADNINNLNKVDAAALGALVNDYFKKLKEAGVNDAGLINSQNNRCPKTIFIFLGYPLSKIGYLLNFLPVVMGNNIATKISPSIEFRASSAIVFSSVLYLVYLCIITLVIYLCGMGWWTLLFLVFPISGYFYLYYNPKFKIWNAVEKFRKLDKNIQNVLKELRRNMLKYTNKAQ